MGQYEGEAQTDRGGRWGGCEGGRGHAGVSEQDGGDGTRWMLVVGVNEGDDTRTCNNGDRKPPHPMTKRPPSQKNTPCGGLCVVQ